MCAWLFGGRACRVVAVVRAHGVLHVEGGGAVAAAKGMWVPLSLGTSDKKALSDGYVASFLPSSLPPPPHPPHPPPHFHVAMFIF